MTSAGVFRLVLVVFVVTTIVIALTPRRGPLELSRGGGSQHASEALPPRAQPNARNVHHSSPREAT